MATLTLQERIARVPIGGVLDISGENIPVDAPDEAKVMVEIPRPITINAQDTIFDVWRPVRMHSRSVFRTRQSDVHLLGKAEIHFPEDSPIHGDQAYEAQHGILLEGVTNFTCEWDVVNAVANSFYCTRNPNTNKPCTEVLFMRANSINAGRAHYGLQCIKRFKIRYPFMQDCGKGHSSIVFEPNGHSDLCQDGVIELGSYKGYSGWKFASGGEGDYQPAHGNLSNVVLRNMVSEDAFGIVFKHGIGNRRGPFVSDMNEGRGVAHRAIVLANGMDGLYVTNLKQPYSGITEKELWDINNCTNVVTSLRA